MSRHTYAGKAAIVGIGATEFSKSSGRSELQLALEACVAACEDAGVDPSQVDGLSTFTMETNPESEIMRGLGIDELTHFSRIHFGGGAPCATVQYAAMAVASGVADYVVCYRAFNERSGRRFGAGVQDRPWGASAEEAQFAVRPHGHASLPQPGCDGRAGASCADHGHVVEHVAAPAPRWDAGQTQRIRRPSGGGTRLPALGFL